MSSEEDDLEEEELLQMALKEQAQRDLNYNKMVQQQQGKPVTKRAEPPMPPSKKPQQKPQQQQQQQQKITAKGRPVEDEEESEVELLSISSEEDDDLSRGDDSRFARRGATTRAARRNYSDRSWDDDEPDNWKHVDEAELARRVREMREAKAAPAVQSRARKDGAFPRKAMAASESLKRGGGSDLVDPLGHGVIDLKSITLVPDSADSSPVTSKNKNANEKSRKDNVIPSEQEAPRDPSLREKVMYHSENFDAKYFLSRIHQNTSATELEAGALALRTDLRDRTQQRKQLVKENFDCFVSCKTTIDDIQLKLKQIESDPEGAGTVHLKNAVQDVGIVANRAFGPLFERQVQVDKIRSVQGTLQRFRTLFNLPSTIRANINNGEYDLAVREYRKAKSIVLPSHVGILKRVLEEVEKVVQEFKATLYKSMEDPQIELSNLENTIRLLLELEPKSDPVWYYLNIQNRRIRGLLEACKFDYEARMDALHSLIRERVQSDARWKQIQQESNKTSSVDYSLLLGDNDTRGESNLKEATGEEADSLRGRLIRRLTAVIVHHIPTFWRLALSIFNGKFAKVSQVGSTNGGVLESNKHGERTLRQNSFEDGEIKYSNHSLDEVVGMVDEIMSVYDTKVQHAFQDLEERNVLRPYMREAIREISKACIAFEGKDCAPTTAVQTLFALRTEATKVFILRLCSWMKATTLDIVNEECWVPVSVLERNGSDFAISASPLSFREIMVSAMDQISKMMEALKHDSSDGYDISMQVQQMQDSVRFTFLNCFLEYTESLERIATEILQSKSKNDPTALQNGYSQVFGDKFTGLQPGVEISNPHQKLLMVLSNIGFCKSEMLHELSNKYKLIWAYPSFHGTDAEVNEEADADIADLITSLSGLEEKVLYQYNFAKSNLIGMAASIYLLEDGIQWGGAPPVKGVRDAAVELLHPLVAVHAEVYAGAKPFLEKTISVLVEGLMDTLLGIFSEHKTNALKSLDINGFCQLMLELDYFETILHSYMTPVADEAQKSLRELLLEKASETASETLENVGYNRRVARGSEDGDERQGTAVSPDDLIAMAHQISADYLQMELKRTQINSVCFRESFVQLDPIPDKGRNSYQAYPALAAPAIAHSKSAQSMGASGYSRHRRKPSGSSLSDSESSKPFAMIHPNSAFNQPGYSSSDVGSEAGSTDMKGRVPAHERYSKTQSEMRWSSRRTARIVDDDLR